MKHGRDKRHLGLLTDRPAYSLPDSGCSRATKYLGHASACQTCPFPKCRLR